MQEIIKDVQKSSYKNMMNNRLPAIIEGASTKIGNGFSLSFTPMDISNSILVKGEDGTEYYSVKAVCTLKNDSNDVDTIEFVADLLHVPALQELGFKIKGNFMQRLDEYERARGWTFWKTDKVDAAKLLAENNRSIAFEFDSRGIPLVKFSIRGISKKRVSVGTFLRAVTGYSAEELVSMFGYSNPYVIEIFSNNIKLMPEGCMKSRNDCIVAVADAMFGDVESNPRTISVMLNDIKENLFRKRYFPMGNGNASRLNYLQSYGYRANGRILAEDIECNGYSFNAGIVLTNEELAVIDALPITELKVEWNKKIYTLRKFSTFTFRVLGCTIGESLEGLGIKRNSVLTMDDVRVLNDSQISTIRLANGDTVVRSVHGETLTVDDLLTAVSIWTDNLNGYDMHAKQYEITNRILVTFDKAVERLVQKHLGIVTANVAKNLSVADFDDRITMAVKDCCKGVDTEAFIASITSDKTNSGQMSDMCNLLAFVSKSSKATSQVQSNAVTPDMVNVQDLQEGRFDPLDVPESDKIGRVHYRTMLSKLDEDGAPMSPFLKVSNGEVVSKEPVYLTAVEEADRFIAEWNETFLNEDGSKKQRVRTRCNGNVQTVELNRVEYKEYSPYQNLSPAHSMIPFPGHSNGKRITMACNQEKQAVPPVKPERPYVGSGGESLLDIGCYTAESILSDFYADNRYNSDLDEATVINSRLELVSTDTRVGEKVLNFKLLDVPNQPTTSLTVPYLLRNFEAAMFSYNINPAPNGIYRGKDVVCYSNSYSLEKKDIVMCADFGAQSVDTSVFDKGIALVKNLNVAYKTFEGSTIEDGILISDRLVFEDELTHIGLFEINDVLSSSDDILENFGISKTGAPEYFNTNGLPEIGTELKGGMPAISKIVFKGGKGTARYARVPVYVSGQVVSAEIVQTYKGTEASVIIAQRSYVQSGDKLAGRCGNKGVTARILPHSQMPYARDSGIVADVVLNPLGVPSRQNITQLLEAALQMCMKMDDKYAIVTPYKRNDTDFVREQAKSHGVVPVIMIDGRTGQEFERPINLGNLPLYKLHHVAKRKIHAVGMDAKLDATFLQPMKGSKQNGGQSFGEMETWCLEATGSTSLLQDLFTFQSDDVITRSKAIRDLHDGDVQAMHGENNNDLIMQACYRSMGVEFSVNEEEKCYEFKPLTDSIIKSFAPHPITNESMLHSPAIFGDNQRLEDRMLSRKKWGWLNLNTKIVLPLWIMKGSLSKVLGISGIDMQDIVNGKKWVNKRALTILSEDDLQGLENSDNYISGMPALVYYFENYDTVAKEKVLFDTIEEYRSCHSRDVLKNSNKYDALIKRYRVIKDFNESGGSLKDYIVTTFPVMPQSYRPVVNTNERRSMPDFDWYYLQIMAAAREVEHGENDISIRELYEKIVAFTGLGQSKNDKYQNLLSFFSGKGRKAHGKIRENVQSKRVMCSGRAAIKPAEDIRRTPMELGIPFTMVVKMWYEQLYGMFRSSVVAKPLTTQLFSQLIMFVAQRDFIGFKELYEKEAVACFSYSDAREAYECITQGVKDFMTDQVVFAGRQPSLHKFSIRAFRPYIVYDYMIHIHPTVCSAYNADFDGDQMYVGACITEESKMSALETLSPNKDFILPKDSTVALEHTQDVLLGLYCATMLKDNAVSSQYCVGDAHFYHSVESIKFDLFNGTLKSWDLAVLSLDGKRYLGTAGRIIFNSLIPDAFTDKQFSNTLGLDFVKPENYREMQYDGIIGSGKIDKGGLQYYDLKDICKSIYENVGSKCIESYQAISEFGFTMSDLFSVSLSLFDFDIVSNKKVMLDEMAKLKSAIEQDYQDGLISDEDKRRAVISIYSDGKNGVNAKIMDDLVNNLPRNNNIFIMMDSGARGNKSQFMHMCGAIGILQKSKTEDLEAAVTSNYYEGLGSFDVHLASYSARTGVASTQNETKNAGYATRQVVYMASGIEVVEEDCGTKDWEFSIDWDDRDASKERFEPSVKWFNDNLLGKTIADGATEELKAFTVDGVFTQASYQRIVIAGGFHDLVLASGEHFVADIYNAKGKLVLDGDCQKILKNLSGGSLSIVGIDALFRKKVKEVATEDGIYRIRYCMDSCCKSMLLHRVAASWLPHLRTVLDARTGITVNVITEDTIKWVEDEGIDTIEVRTVLGCHSEHGICAHCYGLKFSDLQLPEVGSFVGLESAQSIGEPAAQLTMNVINKGGVSGASNISSGVDVFESLIRGALPASEKGGALVAGRSGYLHINRMDNSAAVSIVQNRNSELCISCMRNNSIAKCPLEYGRSGTAMCQLEDMIPVSSISVKDGEWVDAGEPFTYGMIHPDSIIAVSGNSTAERVHMKRQRVWVQNYYNTFKSSGITVNARHFELIAHVQNQYVTVQNAGNTDLEIGKVYEFNEVRDSLEDGVVIKPMVCKKEEAILWNSGAFTALSFEDIASVAANLVTTSYKSSTEHNRSLIGSLSIGENMVTRECKVFNKPDVSIVSVQEAKQESKEPAFSIVYGESAKEVTAFSLGDLDLSSILGEDKESMKTEPLSSFSNAEIQPLNSFSKPSPESKPAETEEPGEPEYDFETFVRDTTSYEEPFEYESDFADLDESGNDELQEQSEIVKPAYKSVSDGESVGRINAF